MSSRFSNERDLARAASELRASLCLRIAIVAPSLEILGGQGIQARALAEGLSDEGHEVAFVPINPAFPRGLRWLRRIPWVRTALNQLLYIPRLLALRHAEVVHIFSASYWSFLLSPTPAILVARLLRKRVILNYHSGEAEDHLANWGARVHPFLRLVDELVVPSEYLRRVFARHGYRARIVRNSVDISRFCFRPRVPLYPRLLSTRNLESHYGIHVIIEAFALVKKHYPEATLTVAGHGSEEDRLRRLASSLGVDGIRFVGLVEPENVPRLYEEADIYLNASVIDNQPVSVLEAFAAGTPVVSTATGDIGHMIRDGETGCLVPQNDPGAIAVAVCALLQNPERAASVARCARKEVERYTWSEVRKAWRAVYAGTPG